MALNYLPRIWRVKHLQYCTAVNVHSLNITPTTYIIVHESVEGTTKNRSVDLISKRYIHKQTILREEQKSTTDSSREQQVAKAESRGEVSTAKKVVEAGKDFTYIIAGIVGIGISVVLFYYVGHEIFSSQTPQGVYSTAFKRCKNNNEVCDELGDPLKAHGEMNRRGRARHVSHMYYEKDGVEHMRLQFYLKGSIRDGTAHCEVKKNENGKWDYRYLFVETDKYPRKTIVIEDNR